MFINSYEQFRIFYEACVPLDLRKTIPAEGACGLAAADMAAVAEWAVFGEEIILSLLLWREKGLGMLDGGRKHLQMI